MSHISFFSLFFFFQIRRYPDLSLRPLPPPPTFQLGFFNTNNDDSKWYLGIWYASIPAPTYVWVANRDSPVRNRSSATLEITGDGTNFVVKDVADVVWLSTENFGKAAKEARLLEEGNFGKDVTPTPTPHLPLRRSCASSCAAIFIFFNIKTLSHRFQCPTNQSPFSFFLYS